MGLAAELAARLAERARALLHEAHERRQAGALAGVEFQRLHIPAAEGGPATALEEAWAGRCQDLELLLVRRPLASGETRWYWQAQVAITFEVFDCSGNTFGSREDCEKDLRAWAADNL